MEEYDDRVVKQQPPIPRFPMSSQELFHAGNFSPDAALLRRHFRSEGRISKECLQRLLAMVMPILCKISFYADNCVIENEPNLLRVKQPCIVIGDIHGQYYDMIHMFERIIDPVFPPK